MNDNKDNINEIPKDKEVQNESNVQDDSLVQNEGNVQDEGNVQNESNIQDNNLIQDEKGILDGMREVVEYSETDADADDSVYVNDRDERTQGSDTDKDLGFKIRNFIHNTRIYKFGIKIQKFLDVKLGFLMVHPVITCLLLALFSEFFIETMSRKSLFGVFGFIFHTPIKFILNYLIVLAPFLIALFVKKKLIPYVVFLAMWITVGIVDFYLLSYRTTPFTGVDIDIDINELGVAFLYLSVIESVLIVMLILVILIVVFSLIFVCPKSKPVFGSRVKAAVTVFASWGVIYLLVMFAIDHNLLSLKFGNLALTYEEEGIAYSLIVTIVDTGMAEPDGYSSDAVSEIVDNDAADGTPVQEDKTEQKDADELPNIIFIQLESFIDPTEVQGVEYSEDPMPYYRSLREQYSSGYLTVPTIVAGTCNTEFEVITGMNLDFFGPGEYPYKTILKETTCESMAYDLKDIGYTAHAIHNNTATFYGRNLIYSHFGFDTFTTIETMCDVEKTPNGWAKDAVLTKSIMDCLESTEGRDLIYTVSVQCHGVYTTVLSDEEAKIKVSGIEDETLHDMFTYYVNEVKEVDNFVRELTTALSNCGEDVVLVMYGDHIPGLSLSNDIMANNDIYTTEYVIWDNIGLEKQDMDITSYQLAAEVFDRLGIHEGTIFNFHQERYEDEDQSKYQSDFYTLQYDMLYGDRYVYGGENPYDATDIVYGINDIIIDKVTPATDDDGDECIYIEGENFNNYSKVFIDDDKEKVELISSTLLRVDISADDIEEGSQIVIKQINAGGTILRESEAYTFFD